jgi:hypothetical protein
MFRHIGKLFIQVKLLLTLKSWTVIGSLNALQILSSPAAAIN